MALFGFDSGGLDPKLTWVSGTFQGLTRTEEGYPGFIVLQQSSNRNLTIHCSDSVLEELAKAGGEKSPEIHISFKAKKKELGSNTYLCVSQPLIRKSFGKSASLPESKKDNTSGSFSSQNSLSQGSKTQFSGSERRIIGQVLEADPESGLLTIQTLQRKIFLKVSPHAAKQISRKLSAMQIQSIDDSFHFDRDRGYFIGNSDLFR